MELIDGRHVAQELKQQMAAQVFAKKIAIALKKAVPCRRIAVLVLGMEVPHAHIHLIPVDKESDLDIKKKIATTPEELANVAEKIRKELI